MPKKLSGGVRFILGFVTFLLCILLFFSTIATIVVSDAVTIVTSQDNMKKIISQILFKEVSRPPLHSIGSGNAAGSHGVTVKPMAAPAIRLDDATSEEDTTAALITWIYESLSEEYGEEMNLTLETVQQFVEESTLKDFIAEKGASLITDYYTGENTTAISEEEIKEQLEMNKDLIKETFDYEISEEEIEEITTKVVENDYIAQIQEEGIVNVVMGAVSGGDASDPNAPGSAPTNILVDILETSRQLLSMKTVWMSIGICAVLLALILVTNIKQIWVGLNKAGITILIAGALFLVPTMIIWNQPADWLTGSATLRMAGNLAREIMIMTAPACIIATAVGAVLLITGIVTYIVVRAKFRKVWKAMKNPAPVAAAPAAAAITLAPETIAILAEEPVAEALVAEEPPVEETPAEEAPAEEAPAEEAPVEEAPAEEAPAEEAPAEEAPVEEAPAEEAPVEEAPAEEAPEAEPAAE